MTRLLHAVADGDRGALAGFVRASQADVWRFCAHLVDPGSADDLTQEVYLRAMDAAPRFRGDASARTWLLSIARRTAADEIRRRQRQRRPVAASRPVAATEPDHTGLVDLRGLIGSLDTDRRIAFVLTQVLGLGYREAAEACGVPIGTIRSRVARARDDLLEHLDERTRSAGTHRGRG